MGDILGKSRQKQHFLFLNSTNKDKIVQSEYFPGSKDKQSVVIKLI